MLLQVFAPASSSASPSSQPQSNEAHPKAVSTERLEKIRAKDVSFFYGAHKVLHDISMGIRTNEVTALIGPSGCGKSTFLRSLNRMNDIIPGARVEGSILVDSQDIYQPSVDVVDLRRRVGMVFQKSNPFPKSIFDNVAYGLRLRGVRKHSEIEESVEHALRSAALWEETKDRLHDSALALSGGQMQRLCIARGLVTRPEILLFDEPTSALDPLATAKVEELISTLRDEVTVLIVTHNMQQAARVSDYTAFMFLGELVEFGDTSQIFTNPKQKATEDYITGRYG